MDDITNADRARWALESLSGFVASTGVDTAQDAISDLMVDLLHLARGRGLDTAVLAQRAVGAINQEVAEDTEGDMVSVQTRFMEFLPDDS